MIFIATKCGLDQLKGGKQTFITIPVDPPLANGNPFNQT